MTPAEAVAALEALVEAGAEASPGEHIAGNMTIGVESRTDGLWEWFANGEGEMTNPGDAHFYAEAANARPALSALAGMCVLPAEVVRALVAVAKKCQGGSNLTCELALYDALAAAEAELRRVEP